MSPSPSPESTAQLAPLLAGIARLVASGQSVTEDQLKTLLLATEAWDDPTALPELERWADILSHLRDNPGPEMSLATARALVLRRLPVAAVNQAVSIAAGPTEVARDRGETRPVSPADIDIVAAANYVVAGAKSTEVNVSKHSATNRTPGGGPTPEEIIVAQLDALFAMGHDNRPPGPISTGTAPGSPGEGQGLDLGGMAPNEIERSARAAWSWQADDPEAEGRADAEDELRRQLDDYFRSL